MHRNHLDSNSCYFPTNIISERSAAIPTTKPAPFPLPYTDSSTSVPNKWHRENYELFHKRFDKVDAQAATNQNKLTTVIDPQKISASLAEQTANLAKHAEEFEKVLTRVRALENGLSTASDLARTGMDVNEKLANVNSVLVLQDKQLNSKLDALDSKLDALDKKCCAIM